ncbi:hypothetical protein R4Q14_08330 [Brachyspira intermedia]|uniref:hypothetical protein n=1 Tax=Brachyspira intermedia TaxID=84377 RepID=UPI0030046A7A
MKKISILLMSLLFILAVSCSSPNNPDNNNNIALSERAGTYSGTMNGLGLVIVLNNNAQVTSIKVGGTESITDPIAIKEGASHTGTSISEFDATVTMGGYPMSAKVRIEFKSGTDASLGATAYVTLPNTQSPIPVDLTYQAN